MQCPNCHNEVREGAVFCGSCGAAIPATPVQPAATAPIAPAAPQPSQPAATQPMPVAAQSDYDRQMAEYQRKQAEYEQQRVAYEQYQQQQAAVQPTAAPQPGYAQPAQYAQPAMVPPASKKKTGLIVGVIAAVVLALGGLAIAGILIARNAIDDAVEDIGVEFEAPVTEEGEAPATEAPAETPSQPSGYATAAEAVTAALQADGYGDWVTQLYKEDSGSATYWAGPPYSEWVSEFTVLQQGDGSWVVERVEALQFGGDVPMTPGDEAAAIVTEFLTAVQQDRADDAHALTIEPFSLDAASASYSNGQFTAFEIVSIEEQSDGTAWVQTNETWYGTTDSLWYFVVPTEAGYRISSLEVR